MSGARDAVLGRIRAALREAPPDVPAARRGYRTAGDLDRPQLLDRFAERVADYRAEVVRIDRGEVAGAVARSLQGCGATRVGVPSGLPPDWRPAGVELVQDTGLAVCELDRLDGALTGCAVAIAETGTFVLDGGVLSGRRALTLVPDVHVCVVDADDVVGLVPEAVERLAPTVRDGMPLTFVSGPSATSDIELRRVEGVHGPRTLHVILAG